MAAASGAARLLVAIDDYPHAAGLRAAHGADGAAQFEFAQVRPIPKAFAPMVRREAYDVSELSIVTALQAAVFARPVILLPLVLNSRFQRQCLIGYRPRGLVDPAALAGRTVGVRAYTQTTGMWVRAALYEDYGIEPSAMRWRTHEPAHVEEYADPPFVEPDTTGKGLPEQLRDGDLPAVVMGNDRPTGPDYAPLIPNHDEADRASYARLGFMPVNHMLAVSRRAAAAAPDQVRQAYRLLADGVRAASPPAGEPRSALAGFAAVEAPVAFAIEEAVRQALIPAPLSLDALFAPARRLLGEGA